jgi:predicted CXXCH cytochrome family protein
MKIRETLFKVFARGAVVCAGLFFALLCVAIPGSAHALVAAKAPDTSMKGATYVGMETCATCHEEQVRSFKLSPHARLVQKGTENEAQGCETCHGPGSKHAENGGGKGNAIINPKKDPTICFTCHMEKKMEFRLPSHHPVLEGKMSCVDCHDLHGSDAKPWTATSMEGVNEVCFKCHRDKQGPYVFEHPAMREGCTACHKVHGSINDKMLQVRDMNLCLKCHSEPANSGNAFTVSADSHSSRPARGTCWSTGCHSDVHGSNFQRHLKPY